MASTKTQTTPTAEAYEAFVAYLRNGGTDDFATWFASDAAAAAMTAFADQQAAAQRSTRMADARAVWRDFKNNGQVTVYSKAHAARQLAYLSALDFDAIVAAPAADASAS